MPGLSAVQSLPRLVLKPARSLHWSVLGCVTVLFGVFYFWLAGRMIEQTRLDRSASDQQAHINLSRESRGDIWPTHCDGVNNPLWAWVARSVSVPDDEEFFVRGKWLNVTLTAVFLALLAVVAGRFLPLLPALNLVVLAGLGALLPRAILFQPEPLYYICIFAAWVCACAILARNRLWLYPLFGLAAGFAYLAKPSSMPFVLIFILVTSARCAWAWWFREADWRVRNHFAGLLLSALCAGAVMGPRMAYAAHTFGDPFHHLHKYWTWMDPGPEKQAFHDRYNAAMRTLPPEERPSPRTYFRTHTGAEAWARFSHGVSEKFRTFFRPEKKLRASALFALTPRRGTQNEALLVFRGLYLLLLLALFAALAFVAWRRGIQPLAASGVFVVLFALGEFLIYLFATGWHHPFAGGERFMLALFLPLAATLVWGCDFLRRRLGTPVTDWFHLGIHTVIALLISVRVLSLALHPDFTDGSLKRALHRTEAPR